MITRTCDFCGKKITAPYRERRVISEVGRGTENDKDICDNCIDSLKESNQPDKVHYKGKYNSDYAELVLANEELKVKHAKLEADYNRVATKYSNMIMYGFNDGNCDSSGGGVEAKPCTEEGVCVTCGTKLYFATKKEYDKEKEKE